MENKSNECTNNNNRNKFRRSTLTQTTLFQRTDKEITMAQKSEYGCTEFINSRFVICGEWDGGKVFLCGECRTRYEEEYPQGWVGYPGDVCDHGKYTGGCGQDIICGYCEEGVTKKEYLDSLVREQKNNELFFKEQSYHFQRLISKYIEPRDRFSELFFSHRIVEITEEKERVNA